MSGLARQYYQTFPVDPLQRDLVASAEFWFGSFGSRLAESQSDFCRDIQSKLSRVDFNRTSSLLLFHGDHSALRHPWPRIVFLHHKPRYVHNCNSPRLHLAHISLKDTCSVVPHKFASNENFL